MFNARLAEALQFHCELFKNLPADYTYGEAHGGLAHPVEGDGAVLAAQG